MFDVRKLLKTYPPKMSYQYLGLNGSCIVAAGEASLDIVETDPAVAC